MTNRDKINLMNNEELGHFFCTSMEIIGDKTKDGMCCTICPVEQLCRKGQNGFITWLNSEAKEEI